METIKLEKINRVLLVTFNAPNRHNPFSQLMMQELSGKLRQADSDQSVGSVVLYGGKGRSFSVGADFNEVSTFTGGDEVDVWLDNALNLYLSVIELKKPIVAAIDGYAIGAGLQLALMCDYRIGTTNCKLSMPELELGVACSFGTFILSHVVGRATMQELVFGCQKLDAKRARETGILHEVIDSELLLEYALDLGTRFASYSPTAVQSTKPQSNATFIAGLHEVFESAKLAHRCSFSKGVAQQKMAAIVGRLTPTKEEKLHKS